MNETDSINWEDPPVSNNGMYARAREIDKTVAELKQHPGKWAKVATGAPSNSGSASWRKRGCEVTTTRTPDGVDIYTRWPES